MPPIDIGLAYQYEYHEQPEQQYQLPLDIDDLRIIDILIASDVIVSGRALALDDAGSGIIGGIGLGGAGGLGGYTAELLALSRLQTPPGGETGSTTSAVVVRDSGTEAAAAVEPPSTPWILRRPGTSSWRPTSPSAPSCPSSSSSPLPATCSSSPPSGRTAPCARRATTSSSRWRWPTRSSPWPS